MIEAVATKQIAVQTEQAAEKSSSGTQQPEEGDVARFEQAMGEEGAQGNEALAVPPEVANVAGQESTGSMGDAILQSFEKIRATHSEKLEHVKESMELISKNTEYSPQEVLKLQWELFQSTFQLEITSKVADKTDQGVSTLLRSQG